MTTITSSKRLLCIHGTFKDQWIEVEGRWESYYQGGESGSQYSTPYRMIWKPTGFQVSVVIPERPVTIRWESDLPDPKSPLIYGTLRIIRPYDYAHPTDPEAYVLVPIDLPRDQIVAALCDYMIDAWKRVKQRVNKEPADDCTKPSGGDVKTNECQCKVSKYSWYDCAALCHRCSTCGKMVTKEAKAKEPT